ncbi:membrane-fusion protein [Acetobacter nitrogenifigens DSM 23921 = NBRC 105050]|uniref:Hemolysin D n=1 Tax=Acetobacter nitrogenifigens DSM 23921 = NBRC 105050 TaxID=1120919 RepID=A0A511X760_9PROT|nr:efflux RND transporter periplasmic adaptor subunit [Acetobacter nitrogenifigens]GBQ95330.1 membrane-fusion protein [Acetobacter nitrogenifigens DSM 23921 = NBRC 105050]GEN58786.1 hemolysin D [Acetobacter nitrogenifigens DSM 23921 = NBRC 105050]
MSEPVKHSSAAPAGGSRIAPLVGVGVLVLLAYGVYGHVERSVSVRALASTRATQAPDVRVMTVHFDEKPVTLELPGETAPLETAAIGARASGYIEKRNVDIGSVVKAGDVLAIIRAPELDRQVARAQASLAQTRANLALAKVTAQRSGGLVSGGAVSRQNFDVDRITQDARAAEQAAADAALAETAQRKAYTTVVAPFDGVVTVRNVEAGDLVSADNAQATPLFVVARTDRLRVRVHVPQTDAAGVAMGAPVTVTTPDRPGENFSGVVTRTGFALERGSRMLPVEVELDNREGKLASGLYVAARFALPRPTPTIVIPSEALIYEADGLSLATVDSDDKVRLHSIKVGRDFGDRLEVLSGLPDGSRLIVRPPSFLGEGSHVKPVADAPAKGA